MARPVGESEFVQGVAAMCESGVYSPATVVGAAIVGTCDLRHPNVAAVLRAHARSRNFRGIRMLRRVNPPDITVDVEALDRGMAVMVAVGHRVIQAPLRRFCMEIHWRITNEIH